METRVMTATEALIVINSGWSTRTLGSYELYKEAHEVLNNEYSKILYARQIEVAQNKLRELK
jgi:hypothetical protein